MSNHTIVISDLHIDYWTKRKIRGKSRKEHFFDFLQWCLDTGVRELVINGDIMDLPPYRGQFAFQETPETCDADGNCIARQVVERLVQFGAKVPVTYVFGNHDIGLSGFRCMGEKDITGLGNVNLCYPNYVIPDIGGSRFLIEHGHFYDPFLILYVNDLTKRTYLPWEFEQFDWTMQRRDPNTGTRVPPGVPGAATPPIKVRANSNAYNKVRNEQKKEQKEDGFGLDDVIGWAKGFAQDIGKAIQDIATEAVDIPKRAIWWVAALHRTDEYLREHPDFKGKLYQFYGHTHRSFVGEKRAGVGVKQRGVQCFYYNSGGWTEDADEGWYLDIDEKGKVWLQNWMTDKESDRTPR